MNTRVCTGHDVPALLQCVDDVLATGLRPTLGLVFCSVAHDVEALGRGLAGRGVAVVGATTAGEIAHAEVLEASCAVMLMELPPDAFTVRLHDAAGGATLFELARQLGQEAVACFSRPIVFVFASGLKTDGEAVVQGIRAGAGRPIPLFGGKAGDDLRMQNTYVFSGEGATPEGLVGLVLDGDRFTVEGIATSGWQPIGIEKTITRSEGNVVYTVDGEPILDVYDKYLGRREDMVNGKSVQYPISLRRADGTEVIRAPLLYDPERDALIFAGSVPEGAKMKFCIPPSLDVVERVIEEAAGMQQCLPDAQALILISCIARHVALGPMSADEIEGLHGLWRAPMLGFFSYGEIGSRDPQHCDFHTETCVLVALRAVAA